MTLLRYISPMVSFHVIPVMCTMKLRDEFKIGGGECHKVYLYNTLLKLCYRSQFYNDLVLVSACRFSNILHSSLLQAETSCIFFYFMT